MYSNLVALYNLYAGVHFVVPTNELLQQGILKLS
jgi:hypothetical protein